MIFIFHTWLPNKNISLTNIYTENKKYGKSCFKITKLPNNFDIQSMNIYYKKCNLEEKFGFTKIQTGKIFKILKSFNETKADDLFRIFLKSDATLWITPIMLSIYPGTFPDAC